MIEGLGERLTRMRKLNGMTQQQVADRIGITAGNYTNYESEKRTPSLEKLVAIAELFDCSTDYLLGLSDKINPGNEYVKKEKIHNLINELESHLKKIEEYIK